MRRQLLSSFFPREGEVPAEGGAWGRSHSVLAKRARNALVALALLACVTAASALTLDRLFPPDLTRYLDRSTEVVDANGRLLRAFTASDGRWRLKATAADVDPLYLTMLKAYEDRRFDDHPGIDPVAVARAALSNAGNGRIVSGASTITMQAARLLEPQPRSLRGKVVQSLRAVQLEWRYSKAEILSIYLTLAPMGGNLEGVRAASLAYLGKEPKQLTAAEAALLVSIPQSPERRRPDRHAAHAREKRDWVLRRMHAAEIIDGVLLAEALRRDAPSRRLALPFHAPHLAAHLAQPHLDGRAPAGAMLGTTIRQELQTAIARLAAEERRGLGDNADIAMVVVDNRSREVVAWHGGSDFWTRHGQVDLVRAKRSPGSALKPFIYALAFDDGVLHPETLIDDTPTRFGDWLPRNFDRGHQGTITVRRALQQSLNVPAVVALERVGAARFIATLRGLGVAPALPRGENGDSLTMALGGLGLSPLDLATLYSGLARGGEVGPLSYGPRASCPLLDARGTRAVLGCAEPETPVRFVGRSAAWHVGDVLAGGRLPDGYAGLPGAYADRRLAFKTGTSYGFRDAWAAGYSRNWTVVVWVGHADGTPRPGRYGREEALPVMLKAFARLPSEELADLRPPPGTLVVAASRDLPPSLRQASSVALRLARAAQPVGAARSRPPRILWPAQGATIEVDATLQPVPLQAEGGSGRLRWLIDGVPLAAQPFRATPLWSPAGPGSARLSVIDDDGRVASIEVRVRLAVAAASN
jgi:penicillin-binding protein 1C